MNTIQRTFRSILVGALVIGVGRAQTTTRVSVDSAGAQGNAASIMPVIAADGRYIAFSSLASNLVSGDTNAHRDVFLRDISSGQTTRVSVSSSGAQGNGDSGSPSLAISSDGRLIAFASAANNLVTGDTNNKADVFLRDVVTGQTTRISVSSSGAQTSGVSGAGVAIAGTGRYIAFGADAAANNLVSGDTNAKADVFVRDVMTGTTERVSVSSSGVQGNGDSSYPSISADGRYVAFYSTANNLVAGDTNALSDVYVRDRQNGTTTRVSVSSSGAQGNANAGPRAFISADGHFVAFSSLATNLVSGDTNGYSDAFVHDLVTGETTRVSVGQAGFQALDGDSAPWSLSADGRYVAFHSSASNLVPNDTNAAYDIFIHDRQLGVTTRINYSTSGAQGDGHSFFPTMTTDGRYVAFESYATVLVGGDTNNVEDAFVRDTGTDSTTVYCAGDGTGLACPCGNNSPIGNNAGCLNSLAVGGRLFASGTASLASDTLTLNGLQMPNNSALYLQGSTRQNNGLGTVFGDGRRCVGGTIMRLGTQINSGGASHYPSGGSASVSVRGQVTTPGTRTYQIWYRNAAAYCTASTFNLSNGLEVLWTP